MKNNRLFIIPILTIGMLFTNCNNNGDELTRLRDQVIALQSELDDAKKARTNAEATVTDLRAQVASLTVDKSQTDLVSTLPHIHINTAGKTIVDEPKIPASFEIRTATEVLERHNIGIELRGATSQTIFEKKSYGFETWDEKGGDLNVELAGYPKEEDWILHGPYSDKTLIRNVLIYGLSNVIGRYATRTSFYSLTINEDYKGTYVLMEKIKRDKNRVNIKKVDQDDITGGYIIKIDKSNGDEEKFVSDIGWLSKYSPSGVQRNEQTNKTIRFLYEYPNADDINKEEKEYLQGYIEDFENALASKEYKDPQNGYRNYIDVDSFVDFFILNEFSKNIDAYRISTYMYKENNNGKLFMGPIWDFNLSFGNADYCEGWATQGWVYQFNSICSNHSLLVPFWWGRLISDPFFAKKIQDRWQELRADEFSTDSLMERIDGYQSYLEGHDALRKNFSRWQIIGKYIWPNYFIGNSYDDEYDYLKNWISSRLDWLDYAIGNL